MNDTRVMAKWMQLHLFGRFFLFFKHLSLGCLSALHSGNRCLSPLRGHNRHAIKLMLHRLVNYS